MSRDHDCDGEAAAYVLGALEPDEAKAFETHLEQCVVCRDEVDTLQQAVDALPMAAPQQALPKRLRRRVLRAVREDAARRPSAGQVPRPVWRRWPRPAFGAGAAVACAAAVAVALVLALGGGGGRVIAARVAAASGTAELRLNGGHGVLVVHHFAPPPPGHIYEVWLKTARQRTPTPANVLFGVTSNGSAQVGLPGTLHGISQVMVTPEPAGGSRVPTHSPVIVATLT
jgi:anti-sigma-K factor RskA